MLTVVTFFDVCESNDYEVHLKFIQCYVNYISIKLKENNVQSTKLGHITRRKNDYSESLHIHIRFS